MELKEDTIYMRMALREAQVAANNKEVPVGAIIVHNDHVIGKAHNQVEELHDPTAHAEILAITQASAALGDWRLLETTLYVTKEPCPMCAGAIVSARIPVVVWAADDPKRGGAVSLFDILANPHLNQRPELRRGLLADEAREMLKNFFRCRRK